jgi:hypothetical protein
MNPLTNAPGGFHCTAVIDPSGIRFVPLPTLVRARKPLRSIVTKSPSKTTVPFTPWTLIGSSLAIAVACYPWTRLPDARASPLQPDQALDAAAPPLEQHFGGVVFELVALVFEDGVPEAPHGLGHRLVSGFGPGDEVYEAPTPNRSPVQSSTASTTPSE